MSGARAVHDCPSGKTLGSNAWSSRTRRGHGSPSVPSASSSCTVTPDGRLALKVAVIGLSAALALSVACLVGFLRPDLPRVELIRKYTDVNSRFIPLPDGSEAHLEILGAPGKPTVVLLHGAMSSVQSWSGWIPSLSTSYRVIAIDLPGHGLTGKTGAGDYSRTGMVTFVHSILGALGEKHVALVGHSMGGGVAAEYAERYPEEVSALVLVDSAGIHIAGRIDTEAARLARNPVSRVVLPWIMPRWELARVLRKMFGDPTKVTDAFVDRMCELERFPGNRAGLIGHYLAPSDDALVEAGLPALNMPVLIEWGGLDTVQPRAAAEVFRRQIPDARLVVYPGVGHDVIEEAAAVSERDAAAFLSGAGW
jgi:pimeloyl-ACP methyl ester carboxylesterase